jgi:hypothetical protein
MTEKEWREHPSLVDDLADILAKQPMRGALEVIQESARARMPLGNPTDPMALSVAHAGLCGYQKCIDDLKRLATYKKEAKDKDATKSWNKPSPDNL